MNIIKHFILFLLIFIIKIDCSPYNHLDLQLALLILSAGDHEGNIINGNDNKPLKINIGKNGSNIEVDIVDIIPRLSRIRKKILKPVGGDTIEGTINKEFKKLYDLAEKVACARLGHSYKKNKPLFNRYKDNNKNMNDEFNKKIDTLDIFRELNNDKIKLINGENDNIITLSFYKYIYDDKNKKDISKEVFNENNDNFIESIYKKNKEFIVEDDQQEIHDQITDDFYFVAKSCNKHEKCRKMFRTIDENGKYTIDYSTKYNLIVNENTGTYYFSVVKNNKITTFPIKYDNNEDRYKVDDDNIKSMKISDVNKRIKEYGKTVSWSEKTLSGAGLDIIPECDILLEGLNSSSDYKYKNSKKQEIEDTLTNDIFSKALAKNENNLLCSYIDFEKYISIEEIAEAFIDKRNIDENNKYEFEIINNLAEMNLINLGLYWIGGFSKRNSFISLYNISKDLNIPPISANGR